MTLAGLLPLWQSQIQPLRAALQDIQTQLKAEPRERVPIPVTEEVPLVANVAPERPRRPLGQPPAPVAKTHVTFTELPRFFANLVFEVCCLGVDFVFFVVSGFFEAFLPSRRAKSVSAAEYVQSAALLGYRPSQVLRPVSVAAILYWVVLGALLAGAAWRSYHYFLG